MKIDEFILQPQRPGENAGLFFLSLDESVYVYRDVEPGAVIEEVRAEAKREAARQAAALGADNIEFVGDDISLNRLTLSVAPGVAFALERLAAARQCTRGDVVEDAITLYVDAILSAHDVKDVIDQ